MEAILEKFGDKADLSLLDINEILQTLVELTRCSQIGENRNKLNVSVFTSLGKILETSIKLDSQNEICVESYRFLRNSMVSSTRNQDAVRENSNLYQVTRHFLHSSCMSKSRDPIGDQKGGPETVRNSLEENKLLAIRCSLQFLANSMVDNVENTATVVTLFNEELNSVTGTFHNDEKVIQYVAMIVHIALTKGPKDFIVPIEIIQHFLKNLHLEFVVYAMESFVALGNLTNTYETLEPDARIRLLNFLIARSDLLQSLNEQVISMIKLQFIERSDFILRSKVGDSDNTFCWEIAVLLEVLCTISLTDHANSLKSDEILLTSVLYLLKQVYEAGKLNIDQDNVFSPVEDLAKLTSESSLQDGLDDIRAHPTFQFKAHLIRLIANLSHRSTVNQNKVRELECLPIILDSCKIDARNPFIAQWSVLAIRNLCEGNEDNQMYVREVQRIDTENLLPKIELVDLNN